MNENYVTLTIGKQKNIALIAHDNKKAELIAWCETNKEILKNHFLCGTGTTARMITDQTGLPVRGYNSVMEEVRRIFKPEFLNRIDETIVFRALNKDDMKQIVALMLKELTDRCEKQMGIHLTVRDSVKKHIVDKAYDPKYGARPLRRQIQNDIEDELAEEILSGKVKKDMEVVVTIHKEKVVFETK